MNRNVLTLNANVNDFRYFFFLRSQQIIVVIWWNRLKWFRCCHSYPYNLTFNILKCVLLYITLTCISPAAQFTLDCLFEANTFAFYCHVFHIIIALCFNNIAAPIQKRTRKNATKCYRKKKKIIERNSVEHIFAMVYCYSVEFHHSHRGRYDTFTYFLNSLHFLSSTSICRYWLFLFYLYFFFLLSFSPSCSPMLSTEPPIFHSFIVSHQWHCIFPFQSTTNSNFVNTEHSLYSNEIYLLCVPTIHFYLKNKKKFQIENALMFQHQRRNYIKATVC